MNIEEAKHFVLPEFVVFTGVDERTDLGRLREMSARWPIEWGVLVAGRRSGVHPRFPCLDMGRRLSDGRLRLAAHLCGRWAAQVFRDDPTPDPEIADAVGGLYGRIQLNVVDGDGSRRKRSVPAGAIAGTDETAASARRAAGAVAALGARRAIVQCRGDVFPGLTDVDWLFDKSGGFGTAPERWPDASAREASWNDGAERVGYAGGLGPDTVSDALAAFSPAHVRSPFWIDMETRIRTDDRLDLDKCEAVCRTVYGD